MKITIVLFCVLIQASITFSQSQTTRPRQVEQTPRSNAASQINPADKSSQKSDVAAAASDSDVLKIETSLVTIPVSVVDRNNRFVSNLRQQDFKIFEDGREQEVGYFGTTEQPITIALVLDTSPSTELRINEIQDAAISFVNQLKPSDRVMVASFDAKVRVLCDPTSDRYRLQKAIRKANFGDGTSLYDAIEKIINRSLSQIQGRKAVVLFTDGVDTTSSKTDDLISLQAAEKSDAPFYAVYFNTINDYSRISNTSIDDDPAAGRGTTRQEYEFGRRYLADLTRATGGRVYGTSATRNLDAAFAAIAEELRRQYVIGFYPAKAGTLGQRRQIQVRTSLPNVTVQARESYVVNK